MAIGTQKKAHTSEWLHKGYGLEESEFGGVYFEVGDYQIARKASPNRAVI